MNFFGNISINTVILAICAIAVFVQQLRSGVSKVSSDTIVAYEAQSKINKETLNAQATQINNLNGEVGRLTGIIGERDKQLAEYKLTIENRNPQLEEILNKVVLTMTGLVEFMKKVDDRLERIEKSNNTPLVATTTIKPQ